MALLVSVSSVYAQNEPAKTKDAPVSNYDYHDAFAPFFYSKND